MSACLPGNEYPSGSGGGGGGGGAHVAEEEELQLMWLGILLGSAGSLGIAIGELGMGRTSEAIKAVEKKAAEKKAAEKTTEERRPLLEDQGPSDAPDATQIAALRVQRVAYRAVFVVSAIANFAAFGFAPNPVLAPLEGLQFVSAFAWAVYYKKGTLFYGDEGSRRVRRTPFAYALAGTLTSMVAIVGVVLSTPEIDSTFGVDGLLCLWARPAWVAVGQSTVALLLLLKGVAAVAALVRKPPTGREEDDTKRLVSAMVWTALVPAIVGAIGATLAKQVSELLRVALSGGEDGLWEVFANVVDGRLPIVYYLGIATGLCFGYWFYSLTKGMSKFEETLALPVYQGSYIVLTALVGGVFFDDFVNYSDAQLAGWATSLAFLVVGLSIIVVGVPEPGSVTTKGHVVVNSAGEGSVNGAGRARRVPALFI